MSGWKCDVIFREVQVGFGPADFVEIQRPQMDALVSEVGGFNIERIFVETESLVEVMFLECFRHMRIESKIELVETSFFNFTWESIHITGKTKLQMILGKWPYTQPGTVTFMLIDALS